MGTCCTTLFSVNNKKKCGSRLIIKIISRHLYKNVSLVLGKGARLTEALYWFAEKVQPGQWQHKVSSSPLCVFVSVLGGLTLRDEFHLCVDWTLPLFVLLAAIANGITGCQSGFASTGFLPAGKFTETPHNSFYNIQKVEQPRADKVQGWSHHCEGVTGGMGAFSDNVMGNAGSMTMLDINRVFKYLLAFLELFSHFPGEGWSCETTA